MLKKYLIELLLVFISAAGTVQFLGCQKDQPDPLEIVARVGNQYLTRETLNSLLPSAISEENRDLLIKNLVEKWIERQVMAQTAKNEGIELAPNDAWNIESVKLEMYAKELLKKEIPENFTITDKEIEDYYDSNKNRFTRKNDEVHIVHLFLEKLDRAIVTEIRQSNSLLDVIQKNFLDRQISRVVEPNGDLGYVEVEMLRPKLKSAIRGTKTGIIYGPIKTDEGYHFLQVLDRKPADSIRRLDLVRSEIIDLLKIEKRQQMIKSYKEKIRKDFQIETFYTNIE
jgi:parvulin-like peptidyl-prolyl isomerase